MIWALAPMSAGSLSMLLMIDISCVGAMEKGGGEVVRIAGGIAMLPGLQILLHDSQSMSAVGATAVSAYRDLR